MTSIQVNWVISPGVVVMTLGARDAFAATGEAIEAFLNRHLRGDWGDVDQDDRQANTAASLHNERLLSVYHLADQTTIWIITEADRSSTTILLPSEY
ncbi:MAG: hypothetical protein M3R24_19120 [Chloroflexota bacterium]|nr:hypothetical protein [Chloroflexota bacterium]